MAVELNGIQLEHLTHVDVVERARLVRHDVPGMAGDVAQVLGRPSVEVTFRGIFYGPTAAADLAQLRQAFAARTPVDFFTESVGEGYFAQVLIADIAVAQRASYLDQFDYTCRVVEYVEPPQPALADPLGAIDAGLLADAAGYMDDVQNAIASVSELTDLIANVPDFGNPTERVGAMLDQFTGVAGPGSEAVATLARLRELLA